MKLALEKYGISLPSFGKIGGILANEVYAWINVYTCIYMYMYKKTIYPNKSRNVYVYTCITRTEEHVDVYIYMYIC